MENIGEQAHLLEENSVSVINLQEIAPEAQNFDEIIALLNSWGLQALAFDFARKGIDIEVFKCLTIDDINRLIPDEHFGLRVKFRQKLFEWRHSNGYCTPLPETVSNLSSVESWLNNNSLSPASNPSEELILDNLLSSSVVGKNILSERKPNFYLTKANRQFIVGCICDYWIEKKIQVTSTHFNKAAEEIVRHFPTESKEIYIGSNKQRGKLAEKYYSVCKKYQGQGLISSRYKLKRKLSGSDKQAAEICTPPQKGDESVEFDVTIIQNQTWLKNNKEPETLIFEKWKITYNLRRSHFLDSSTDIFAEWPLLKQRIGAILVELDFEELYPSKNLLLFSKWSTFCEKVLPVYLKETKDPKCKSYLKQLTELRDDITDDSANYLTLILLCSIITPTIIITGKGKDKGVWKPSILDSQCSLAVLVKEKSEIYATVNARKALCIKKKQTFQPLIVLVGDLAKIEKFYIYFNDIYYNADSFLKAISLSFQIHQVFNIAYAVESAQIWHFIEEFFYEIPVSGKKSNSLLSLLKQIKN